MPHIEIETFVMLISIIHHILSALGEKKLICDIIIFYSGFEVCPVNNLLCENILLFFLLTPLSLLFPLSAWANLMILHKNSLDNIPPACQPQQLIIQDSADGRVITVVLGVSAFPS